MKSSKPSGMGLIEVMVASGVLAIIVTAMTQFMSGQQKNVKDLQYMSARDAIKRSLDRYIGDPVALTVSARDPNNVTLNATGTGSGSNLNICVCNNPPQSPNPVPSPASTQINCPGATNPPTPQCSAVAAPQASPIYTPMFLWQPNVRVYGSPFTGLIAGTQKNPAVFDANGKLCGVSKLGLDGNASGTNIGDLDAAGQKYCPLAAYTEFYATCGDGSSSCSPATYIFVRYSILQNPNAGSTIPANMTLTKLRLILSDPVASGVPLEAYTNGAPNYLALWQSTTSLGASHVYEQPTSYNIGIGITNPTAQLHLYGATQGGDFGIAQQGDTTPYMRIGMDSNYTQYVANNAYWAGSAYKYVNTAGYSGQATRIGQYNGTIEFDTSSGGTNPITWNPRLYLANNGNIGIGTTSPGAALDVYGTVNASASDGWGRYLSNGTSGVLLGATNAAGSMQFYTGGFLTANERMVITSGGNVGIGTTNPGYKFQVAGVDAGGGAETISSGFNYPTSPDLCLGDSIACSPGIKLYATYNHPLIQLAQGANYLNMVYDSYSGTVMTGSVTINYGSSLRISSSKATLTSPFVVGIAGSLGLTGDVNAGNINTTGDISVGVASSPPGVKITAAGYITALGNIHANGTITAASDIRLKKDLTPISDALDKLLQIKGYYYHWKDPDKDQGLQIGVIAQDVEKVFPEAVREDDKGIKSVAYQNLVAPLIEALRQQNERIQDLEKKHEALLKQVQLQNCQETGSLGY